jgi:hypothetical protein
MASEGIDATLEAFDVTRLLTRFTCPVGKRLVDAVKERVSFREAAAVLAVPSFQHEQLGVFWDDFRGQPLEPTVETMPLFLVQDLISVTNDQAAGLRGAFPC